MSDLRFELYVRLQTRRKTDGVPTDRRIMAAFANSTATASATPTRRSVAIVADCEPDGGHRPAGVDGLRVAARRRRLYPCASGGVRVGHGRTS